MEIIVAKSAGYCFGVSNAIKKVYNEIGKGKLYTYGPIIHNKQAIKQLEGQGVFSVDNIDEAKDGRIFIRAHGVPLDVYRELTEKQIDYIDCTCVYVKKIHDIVSKYYSSGYTIIIAGDDAHPEVVGIVGFAEGNAYVVNTIEDIENIILSKNKAILVAQTTFSVEIFREISKKLKNKYTNIEIFDTICSATSERQKEVHELSKSVTHMLIVGDKKSANTKKLYEISKSNCENTQLLETICDLQLNIFKSNDKIGITAGASTPPDTLKEVVKVMSDLIKENIEEEFDDTEQTFEQMLEGSFVSLHTGDIVKGTVISISNDEVSVNLGYKSDGIIQKGEFSSDPNITASGSLKPDDEIEVYVLRVNDGEGNVLLSKKRLEAQKGMADVERAFEEGEVISGKVIDVVKGGLIANFKGVRIFIPSSQISNRFVEDLNVFAGKELSFKIIELDKSKRRIVGGRKEIAKKEEELKKDKVYAILEKGKNIEGKVSRITNFGAFVDLGGVDGLIHISEMSWGMVSHPSEVLKEGQAVSAIVLDINREKNKISLSLKDIKDSPWANAATKYAIGDIIDGKVVRMVPFGAFIELEPGIDGLVHISQISSKHVVKAEDELKIGEIFKFKIIDANMEQRKISLSKKEAEVSTDDESEAEAEKTSSESAEEA